MCGTFNTAVAVHPKDKRFKKYLGKNVILPLTTRKVKIDRHFDASSRILPLGMVFVSSNTI